ncbi:MAG: Ser-Thr-rich GPI-anchored membrane family protein [Candidatus Krumholzibacteriia bacterium]
MRRLPYAPLVALLLPLSVLLLSGCGGDDDGAGPGDGACAIAIITPAPDTHFYSGQDVNLRWDAAGGGQVRIELLKGGAPVDTLVAATDNDGFYYWAADTRGAISGDDFALRVTSTTDAGCTDTVPIALTNTVGCAITLTVPPDSALVAGQEYLITWDGENTGGSVDIGLWKGPLQLKELVGIIALDAPDNGSYLWQPVDSFNQGTATDYYLRVADTQVAGCEGQVGPFRLTDPDICYIDIMAPVQDDEFTVGQQMTIVFDSVNAAGSLNIRLHAGATLVPGGYIADGVPAAAGQHTWTVTDYGYTEADDRYRIVIFAADDNYCTGESGYFSIR